MSPAPGPVPAPALVTPADIEAARTRIGEVAGLTPLERNDRLSAQYGCEVWLKREDLQPVRSYKIRGAFNFIVQLDEASRSRGVVCASAGNHAQGVALACQRLGTHGRIFVPGTTPRQKRERVAALGGDQVEVIVAGDSYEDALRAALDEAATSGATVVPAFDAPQTIAGQGTVGMEILEQLGASPDVLVAPVGGGGLLAGVATWMAHRSPGTRLVGVEPSGAPSMTAAFAAGGPTPIAEVDPFVDGAAVRIAGELTYPLIAGAGTTMVCVDEGRLCTEMLAMYQADGIIAEPAGALATAALEQLDLVPGSTVVCIVSGGNNDISRYGEVLERSLIHQGLKHYFLVSFPQEPGALRRFLADILGPDDDITLFDYVKRNNRETGPALIGVELGRAEDLAGLLERMQDSPLGVERVTPGSPLFHYLL